MSLAFSTNGYKLKTRGFWGDFLHLNLCLHWGILNMQPTHCEKVQKLWLWDSEDQSEFVPINTDYNRSGDLCPEELPSKELVVFGWKGAWNVCFDSNRCIFLISDFWVKKKSIKRWWDEKERRWGREAWHGTAQREKHLSGKAGMGIQCWRDRQSQGQDRSPPAAVGGWTSPTPTGLCTTNSSLF